MVKYRRGRDDALALLRNEEKWRQHEKEMKQWDAKTEEKWRQPEKEMKLQDIKMKQQRVQKALISKETTVFEDDIASKNLTIEAHTLSNSF